MEIEEWLRTFLRNEPFQDSAVARKRIGKDMNIEEWLQTFLKNKPLRIQ